MCPGLVADGDDIADGQVVVTPRSVVLPPKGNRCITIELIGHERQQRLDGVGCRIRIHADTELCDLTQLVIGMEWDGFLIEIVKHPDLELSPCC